ncbi:uncharacterized protein LOC135475891 isoform X2 [Liolophura sinensis]|uniref:uncharacterized protein LOC135475891 isoform X2 n=1 Tax=Liolophura sinensis TaxID=3198878 RepID=UPI0031584650
MAGISFRTDRTGQRNSPVTARCIAIVLGPDRSLKTKKEKDNRVVDPITGQEILDTEKHIDSDKRSQEPPSARKIDSSNGKEIFEEFKVRNRTCYWNPALVESVKNLEYLGFVEPCTLLVGGEDLHLENVRTAWGRHVLKPPANFVIEKIGDVGGIQMQVVPQTQFIPLPESLCLIIMDLNNNRIIATLDLIRERLAHCYGPDMQLPNDQLIYDTLGQLIRERKVFHTGSGYFVVTPDTYRLRTDDHSQTYGTAMVQYHPMYIPVPHFSHLPPGYHANRAAQMRTISCQTKGESDPPSRGRVKLERSHSMKGSKGKDLPQKECVDEPELKRSMSVKYKTERGKTVYKDINLKNSNLNQEKDKGEKVSLLSKLFGKGKKKAPPPPPVKEVEYASFSAQFPPPEWQWYQQQIEKHRRVEDWVKNQIPKSETWPYLQAPPYSVEYNGAKPMAVFAPGEQPHQGQFMQAPCPVHSGGEPDHHGMDSHQRAATLPPHRHSKRKQGRSKSLTRPEAGRHKGNSELTRSAERLKLSYESYEHGGSSVEVKENADPQLQGPPHPIHSFMSVDEHPYGIPYHSTPREPGVPMPGMPMLLQPHPSYMDESYQPRKGEMFTEHSVQAYGKHDSKEPHYNRRAYKAKKKQQRASENHRRSFNEGDISYEYKGKLPKKESSFAVSCESGVNCVGQLSNDDDGKPGQVSSHLGQVHDGQPGSESQGRAGQADHSHSRHKSYLMNNSVMKKSHRHKHRGHREKCIPEESEVKDADDSAEIQEHFKAMNVEKVDVCVHRNFEESQLHVEAQITTNAVSTTGSSGEAINSNSGQSCETVLDNHKNIYSKEDNKAGENVTMDGKEVSVGDSGFGSPRNVEVSPDNKFPAGDSTTDSIQANTLPQTKHGLNILRNTDRMARKYPQHRSSSGSAYAAHISPYANGCPIPLNNQRPKESNIDTAHKQRPKSQGDVLVHPYPSQNDVVPYQFNSQGDMIPPQYSSQNVMDEKLLQVSRKFQMEGDFEVVGVV